MNTTPAGINSADVRAWAIVNGWPQLAGRNGRLPKHAIEQYVNAHGTTSAPVEAADSAPPSEGAA